MKVLTDKITPQMLENFYLVFYPETVEEAELIQKRLFAMGVSWYDGSHKTDRLQECVNRGMATLQDHLYADAFTIKGYSAARLCTSAQFENASPLPPEQVPSAMAEIRAMRDEITRQGQMIGELRQMVAEMHADAMPKKIVKDPLKP